MTFTLCFCIKSASFCRIPKGFCTQFWRALLAILSGVKFWLHSWPLKIEGFMSLTRESIYIDSCSSSKAALTSPQF